MANKEVKQCRFYVDLYSYFHAVGYANFFNEGDSRFLYLDCPTPTLNEYNVWQGGTARNYFFCGNSIATDTTGTEFVRLPATKIDVIGLLNHNWGNFTGMSEDGMSINLNYSPLGSNNSQTITTTNMAGLSTYHNIGSDFTATANGIIVSGTNNGVALTHLKTGGTVSDPEMPHIQPGPIGVTWTDNSDFATEAEHPFNLTGARLQLGSWFVGSFYDTPYSPNLTLTMTRDFDGIDSERTISDKLYHKINYDGPTPWTQYNSAQTLSGGTNVPLSYEIPSMEITEVGPFSYEDGNDWQDNLPREQYGGTMERYMARRGIGKKGKRKWQLNFDYMSDTEMWIDKEYSSPILDGVSSQNMEEAYSPQISDKSFQWVWSHTLGGKLPFIFCPDKNLIATNNDKVYENLAICIFDSKSLQVRQTAPNLYSVSVSIREL